MNGCYIVIIIIILYLFYKRKRKPPCKVLKNCKCKNRKQKINIEKKLTQNNISNIPMVKMSDSSSSDIFADSKSEETSDDLVNKSFTSANIDGPLLSGMTAPLESFEERYERRIGL